MKPLLLACLLAASPWTQAQVAASPATPQAAPAPSSNLDGELFLQLLLGEINLRQGEPAAAYALVLEAARRTRDPVLFRRAIEIAIESRAGESAIAAARAWSRALPDSREAPRTLLQLLIVLNRFEGVPELVQEELRASPQDQRLTLINSLPGLFVRAGDKAQAASTVEAALANAVKDANLAAAAWTSIGRVRLMAGDNPGALNAARLGHGADAAAEGPVLLAIELMDPSRPEAERLVVDRLRRSARPELHLGYARALIDANRSGEATNSLQKLLREQPDYAPAWLALGGLQVVGNDAAAAERSLRRHLELVQDKGDAEEIERGRTQAYLMLAQIEEKRGNYRAAEAWLERIDDGGDLLSVQARRASLLAGQGRIEEGRRLLRELPERTPADARAKVSAEASLLREHKLHAAAFEVLQKAVERFPDDADLRYDQAMVAEKLGRLDAMEALLRQVIERWPNYHHAYNALGYSMADRSDRLPEARELIRKALSLAPGDPFITDSLGWVEFRMGNLREAERILHEAFKSRPDAEIAAHLGEVLWKLGDRDQARKIWREGRRLAPDNETLAETLRRLGAAL